MKHNLSLGIPEFVPDMRHLRGDYQGGSISICGSGPSLADYDPPRPIMAVNGAHDYLTVKGCPPDFAGTVDPTPQVVSDFLHASHDTKYFCATQCHPDLIQHLAPYDLTLFTLYGKHELELFKGEDKWLVAGGSTSALRMICLAYMMGFRSFHLYGMDCSFRGNNRNLNRTINRMPQRIEVNGREFESCMEFAQQLDEIQDLMGVLNARFYTYGDHALGELFKAIQHQQQIEDVA